MSDEQFKEFLDAVKADPGLQEKLKGAANPADLEAIAKQAGFVISADAFAGKEEISEDELEGVAGGGRCAPIEWVRSLIFG
jgi:predicted ribosomally synthesized peptide with nif11-like leader